MTNLVAVRSPLAAQTYERLVARTEFNAKQRRRLERFAPWVAQIAAPPPAITVGSDEIAVGVMGYRCPDYVAASRNIGDWVQTIAMMSHFARRPDIRFTGDDDLSRFFQGLQAAVPTEKRISGPSGKVKVVEFNRDANSYDTLPEHLWAFVFGWYFKRPFERLEFPFPANIHPIFISFHISNASHVTDAAVAYLKRHSPIGCRDWHTVRVLRAKGVECYFSGCVTTTTGGLFPASPRDASKPVAYVDAGVEQIPENDVALTNLIEEMRVIPLSASLEMARDRLISYSNDFSKIVTSRLHTFLPSESMGAIVEWRPVHENDRRFDGLIGSTEMPRGPMSARITQIVRVLLDGILNGAAPESIYEIYRAEVSKDILESAAKISG